MFNLFNLHTISDVLAMEKLGNISYIRYYQDQGM